MRWNVVISIAMCAASLAGCSTEDVECTSNDRCALGLSCVGGLCIRVGDGDVGTDADASTADADASTPDADASTPDADASTTDADASTPDADASTPDADASTPDADAGGGTACTDDAPCAPGYVCDTAAELCFTGCTEVASECAAGFQCVGADDTSGTAGICEVLPTYYDLVVIYSDTPADAPEVTDSDTPGPDIDAVELARGARVLLPTEVDGASFDAPSNSWDNPDAVLVRDGMTGDGPWTCTLSDANFFYSLGGSNDGYIALSFDDADGLRDGDIITVYEASASACPGIVARNEPYLVYLESTLDRTVECELGASADDGGVTTLTFDRSACP